MDSVISAQSSAPSELLQAIFELATLPGLLPPDRVQAVKNLAPEMPAEKQLELKKALEAMRDESIQKMKARVEMEKAMGAAHLEWTTIQAREARQTAESQQLVDDMAAADALLLNQ